MDRIKGKFVPPLTRRTPDGQVKPAEQPRTPGYGLPSSSRLVGPGSNLGASQREQNRQLVALYHAMRDIESGKLARESVAEPGDSIIKGWKKRTPRKAPVKSRDGRAKRQPGHDGQEQDEQDDGEQSGQSESKDEPAQ